MFWRKTTVGGEKEGEKKKGKPLSPLFSVCSRGARRNKIIQRVQLAVDAPRIVPTIDFESNP